MRKLLALLALPFLFAAPVAGQLRPNAPKPPVAKTVPRTTRIHGEVRVDNYFWLREKTNPEVITYLKAENAYTDAVMRPTWIPEYPSLLERIAQALRVDVHELWPG